MDRRLDSCLDVDFQGPLSALGTETWTTSLAVTAKFGQPGFGCNSVLDTLPCQTVQGIMPFARTQPPASQSRVQGRDLELRNNSLITGTLVTHRVLLILEWAAIHRDGSWAAMSIFCVFVPHWAENVWLMGRPSHPVSPALALRDGS